MTLKDSPATENKYFDQRSCGKVVRIGAVACAAVLAGGVVSLVRSKLESLAETRGTQHLHVDAAPTAAIRQLAVDHH